MFEYRCTKCGKMKIAPLDMLKLKNFVCWECEQKEKERRKDDTTPVFR